MRLTKEASGLSRMENPFEQVISSMSKTVRVLFGCAP